ncbi:MAG: hypothetical protein H6747_14365 [Deltaproteobacteria bacterium]|nr:hypothetical protein [Deltaproteobacteria bacterium]
MVLYLVSDLTAHRLPPGAPLCSVETTDIDVELKEERNAGFGLLGAVPVVCCYRRWRLLPRASVVIAAGRGASRLRLG